MQSVWTATAARHRFLLSLACYQAHSEPSRLFERVTYRRGSCSFHGPRGFWGQVRAGQKRQSGKAVAANGTDPRVFAKTLACLIFLGFGLSGTTPGPARPTTESQWQAGERSASRSGRCDGRPYPGRGYTHGRPLEYRSRAFAAPVRRSLAVCASWTPDFFSPARKFPRSPAAQVE